ncbi:hypothetical protein FRB90_005664 [Tulasnella sp. 427]|nr:hypothetical protein FRB90_005664 [Tulasnella sp. 427]
MDILVVRLARELDEMKQTLGEVAREMDEVKRKLREAEAKDKHWALENIKLRRDMRQLQMSLGQTKSSSGGRLMQDIPPTPSSTGQDRSLSLGAPVTTRQVSHHPSDIDNDPRPHGNANVQGAQQPSGAALHANSHPHPAASFSQTTSTPYPIAPTQSFTPARSHVGVQYPETTQTSYDLAAATEQSQPVQLMSHVPWGPPGGTPSNAHQIAGPSNLGQHQHPPQIVPPSTLPTRGRGSYTVARIPPPSAAGVGNQQHQVLPRGYGAPYSETEYGYNSSIPGAYSSNGGTH